ncbi:CoA-binding protein [uncultured Thalassospira sp.]|mgnify:FL=1|uniref:CoA-binding protein n=1 Tax=uncultured Thalassospira sp. TaxID=404382 RepID=UPI0030DD8A7D|tara:strand:- start:901 stop:1347 length:447 start_codon:yes stop_codon:yes gene_type:complete
MTDFTNPDTIALRNLFNATTTIALVGASPKPERPSNRVMAFLLARGFHVVPVNPGQAGGKILGQKVYAQLADIPEPVDMVDIFRKSEDAGGIVDEAIAIKAKSVWMQLNVIDKNAAMRAQNAGLIAVMDRCPAIEIPQLFVADWRKDS